MKHLALCFALFCIALPAQAKSKSIKSFDLLFLSPHGNHRYTLLKGLDSEKYVLKFHDGHKLQTKNLNLNQGQGLMQLATRITWNSKYRKPASLPKTCTKYAHIKSGATQSQICEEDAINTGETTSLLNQMRKLFK